MESPVDVTYLADTVILMRYFETQGRVRRALSVIKKRPARTKTPFVSFISAA
jgi:circadian clock protein KaiC